MKVFGGLGVLMDVILMRFLGFKFEVFFGAKKLGFP